MLEAWTQYPQKLNVWAGVLSNILIGPFSIDENLTAAKYEDMLRHEIILAIRWTVGDNFNQTWYQHNGAGPHFGLHVRRLLDTEFLNRRIGRRGEIERPTKSPLDYFLWGHLKSKVYGTAPRNLEQLRRRILQEAAFIDPGYIRNAVFVFYDKLAHCQTANDAHFKHLL